MWWFLACTAGDGAGDDLDWAVQPADLGAPVVDGNDFDPADGDALGAAFAELVPGLGEGFPTWEVPLAAWAMAMDDLVADDGSCPARALDGGASVFTGDCRSRDGFEWAGSVTVTETGGQSRYDFDLEVVADVEDPAFERVALHGSILRVQGDEADHVDSNVEVAVEGYFEARSEPTDPRVVTWANWASSGSVEVEGTALRLGLAGRAGGSGDFELDGELQLDGGCPTEPTGEATMGSVAVASFEGVAACDACATVVAEGTEVLACAP